MRVGQLPRVPLHRTPSSISRAFRQKHRSPEPDCPRRSSLPGIPETASLGPDQSPQRSASSDPSANGVGIIPRESNNQMRFHTVTRYLTDNARMGRRGINAKPKRPPEQVSAPHPWQAPGLSRAERVIAFCETLPITAGLLAGSPLRLRPWQKRFIRAVYRTDSADHRLIRTAVLSVARKNGKTQLASALALCHLSGPEAESRGECYSVACTRNQAGRVFNEMTAIITRTPWLDERINIIRFRKELEDDVNGSTFAVLSADVAPVHGLSPSFVCYDELAQVPSRALFDALGTALGARSSPLMVVISTQAATDTAPMSELVDYGLRVNRGEVEDPHFHLTLDTAPPDADPWSRATWKKANPALADFRSLEDVKRLALQAQRMPSAEASFRNLILNQRVDTTEHFISPGVWKACGGGVVNTDT